MFETIPIRMIAVRNILSFIIIPLFMFIGLHLAVLSILIISQLFQFILLLTLCLLQLRIISKRNTIKRRDGKGTTALGIETNHIILLLI